MVLIQQRVRAVRGRMWITVVAIPAAAWVVVYMMSRPSPPDASEHPCSPPIPRTLELVTAPPVAASRASAFSATPRPELPSAPIASPQIDISSPLSPDYDSAATYNMNPGPPDALFAREPRQEKWAAARETAIRDIVLANVRLFDPDAEFDIECHTATCMAHLRTQNAMLSEWKIRYPLGCLVDTYAVMVGDDPVPDFYLMFDGYGRSEDGMRKAIENCSARHAEWMIGVSTGHGPWGVKSR